MPDTHGYGWNPDAPDDRDYHLASPAPEAVANLPKSVDLRGPNMPDVYDQGQLGSCTANAAAGLMQYERRKAGHAPDFVPARLFVYYEERVIEGTVGEDSGAQLRDAAKVLATSGVCPETDWPYDISTFTRPPTPQMFVDAAPHKAVRYARVAQDLTHLKATVAAGNPIMFGFTVYASFESAEVARTGVMPMPKRGEQILGGHATLIVGYDDAHSAFLVRNSWGSGWGQGGYFWMPYPYATNRRLASDFWTVTVVDQAA
jgi:C1A family cysteine protease